MTLSPARLGRFGDGAPYNRLTRSPAEEVVLGQRNNEGEDEVQYLADGGP